MASRTIREARGREPILVASPGIYDQKHFARIAGVEHCVAYGPGELSQAPTRARSLSLRHR